MIEVLMFIIAGGVFLLGTKMGPSAENNWANTSGMPAYALAILLIVWAFLRIAA